MAPDSLGMRIRRARERKHWTQRHLADAVGASVRAVGDWERDIKTPRNRIGALEDVLGVNLSESSDVLVFRSPEEEDFWRNLQVAGVGEDERRKLLEQFRRNREAPVRREAG